MSRHSLWIVVWLLLAGFSPSFGASWLSSYDAARSQANAFDRPILIFFTASAWCPPCNQLKSKVLDTSEFTAFADECLILAEVDLSQDRGRLRQLQQQSLITLLSKHKVETMPALYLVNVNGDLLGKLSADSTQSPQSLIASIESLRGRKAKRPHGTLFNGATTLPPPNYTNLVVKSITYSAARRFALINSETLTPGDSAWFKLGSERVKVRCVDIQEKSVVVQVQGEPKTRELQLAVLPR
jgi:Thioredoxin-like